MIPIRNVRSVLYATAILFAVVIVGICGAFLRLEYRDSLNRTRAATQDLALLMEEYTKRTLETSDLLLGDIISHVRSRGGVAALAESEETRQYLNELTRKSSAGDLFLIIDNQGNTVAVSTVQPRPPVNFSDRTWFKAHRAGAETFVGGAIIGRIANNEILYTYSRRIPDRNGEFDGVAEIALRPTFLQGIPRPDAGTADVILGLWSRDGRVIARTGLTSSQINSSIGHTSLFTEREAQKTGTYRTSETLDGTEVILSFRRLERWPVTVTASIPVKAALGAWRTSLYWSTAITIIVLVALGWLTWIGARLSHRMEGTQRQLQQANLDLAEANGNLGRALADKVMLLQEIHHRVKNNLQVTSSLLQMQARRFEDPDVKAAFQETQDRLRSIGLIHDLLYRRDTGGMINLQDYLGRLLQELSATYGASEREINVVLDSQAIAVDLDRGTPLALAVTEAVINAFKHAFEPGRGGRISVSARRIDGQIEILVHDNGKGVTGVPENDTSLGMKLIRAFSSQLGGQFSIETENGTTFRLLVPA